MFTEQNQNHHLKANIGLQRCKLQKTGLNRSAIADITKQKNHYKYPEASIPLKKGLLPLEKKQRLGAPLPGLKGKGFRAPAEREKSLKGGKRQFLTATRLQCPLATIL